jgi:hypothetical protein
VSHAHGRDLHGDDANAGTGAGSTTLGPERRPAGAPACDIGNDSNIKIGAPR